MPCLTPPIARCLIVCTGCLGIVTAATAVQLLQRQQRRCLTLRYLLRLTLPNGTSLCCADITVVSMADVACRQLLPHPGLHHAPVGCGQCLEHRYRLALAAVSQQPARRLVHAAGYERGGQERERAARRHHAQGAPVRQRSRQRRQQQLAQDEEGLCDDARAPPAAGPHRLGDDDDVGQHHALHAHRAQRAGDEVQPKGGRQRTRQRGHRGQQGGCVQRRAAPPLVCGHPEDHAARCQADEVHAVE
mmetsp:Transcript_23923/g.60941  ORF Transcript_23923/g.60941 Transcript_23923/m.60941 type:complete len:246 (-) Transcript_23923:473-1210(-)